MMLPRIIGHDLGACSGWAIRRDDGTVKSGVHNSKPAPHADRLGAFYGWVCDVYEKERPEVVVYEFVRFPHKSTDAARLYYFQLAAVLLAARALRAEIHAIPVQLLKQVATRTGAAGKQRMEAAARSEWPEQRIYTPDQCDALWLMRCGELLSQGRLLLPEKPQKPHRRQRRKPEQEIQATLL